MGQKLLEYYEKAKQIGGPQGKVDFIKIVALAASQAEAMPDSAELIAKFEAALKQIKRR